MEHRRKYNPWPVFITERSPLRPACQVLTVLHGKSGQSPILMDVIRLLFHLFGCFLPFNAEVGSLRYSIRIESVPIDTAAASCALPAYTCQQQLFFPVFNSWPILIPLTHCGSVTHLSHEREHLTNLTFLKNKIPTPPISLEFIFKLKL